MKKSWSIYEESLKTSSEEILWREDHYLMNVSQGLKYEVAAKYRSEKGLKSWSELCQDMNFMRSREAVLKDFVL